jgi:DNA repair exonuclease SbcCD nuclease subunit
MSKKIGIFTDTHLGARGGSTVFREYFGWYYHEVFFPYLKEHGITTLFMLGDFFDNRNHLSLSDIAFVNQVFLPLLESHGCTMYIIAGNHDLAFKNTNSITSLSVMEHSEHVHILKDDVEEFEFDGSRFVFVPWINGSNYDEFMDDLNNIKDKQDVTILGHFEIEGFLMYKNSSRCEHGLDQKVFKDFKSVWSGHFHHQSKIGNIEYLGATFHLNWQDHNDKRGFWVYDTDTQEKTHVENEHSLFTEILYEDEHGLTHDQINEFCEHQFVKIVINEEYDKVKFMDFYSKVTGSKPIDVQIENNYAILSTKEYVSESSDDTQATEDKSIDQYIQTYVQKTVEDDDKKSSIMNKFVDVKSQASDMMVKGE